MLSANIDFYFHYSAGSQCCLGRTNEYRKSIFGRIGIGHIIPAFWGLIAGIPSSFILETIDRHCAAVGRYEELTFKSGPYRSLIVTGCVRRPEMRGLGMVHRVL